MTRDSRHGTPIPPRNLNQPDIVFKHTPPVLEPNSQGTNSPVKDPEHESVKGFFTEFPLSECIALHQDIHHVLLHRIESEARAHEESLTELNKLHHTLKILSQ